MPFRAGMPILRNPGRRVKALTLYVHAEKHGRRRSFVTGTGFLLGRAQRLSRDRCPKGCSLLDLQEILDRWIWKGTRSSCARSRGPDCKACWSSRRNMRMTRNRRGPQPHRAPVGVCGVHHDEVRDVWIVNTVPLDKNKLYTAAMSDYVALGDTGYPDLAKPPFGDPPRQIFRQSIFKPSAAPFARTWRKPPPVPGIAVHCAPEIRPRIITTACRHSQRSSPGQDQLASLRLWSYFHGQRGEQLTMIRNEWQRTSCAGTSLEKTDEGIQERPTWQFSLDKLAIGFSGLWHVQDEKTVQQNFGGIRSTQVTAKRFHSWDTEINDQFTRFVPMRTGL